MGEIYEITTLWHCAYRFPFFREIVLFRKMSRNSFVTNLCPSFKEKQKKELRKQTYYLLTSLEPLELFQSSYRICKCQRPNFAPGPTTSSSYLLISRHSIHGTLSPSTIFFSCKQVFFLDEININRCVLSSISGWDERFSNHRSRIKRVRRTMAQDRIKCLKHCLSPYDFFPPIQQFFLFLLHYNKYI